MTLPPALGVSIRTHRDASIASLDARSFARDCGLDHVEQTRIATVVAELAGNIVKYAERGRVRISARQIDGARCIDVVVSDRGPGIASIDEAMRDHSSTGGTLGLGLPGVRRLVDEFDISSTIGSGTVVRVRRWVDAS